MSALDRIGSGLDRNAQLPALGQQETWAVPARYQVDDLPTTSRGSARPGRFDVLTGEGGEDGVAEATVGVVFDRDDDAADGAAGFEETVTVDGLDGEQVDATHGGACPISGSCPPA